MPDAAGVAVAARGGGGRGGGRGLVRRQAAQRLARRHAGGVHPRLESLGARRRHAARSTQLTTDGVKDFGYATDNAGWSEQRPRDRCSWSPDSKKIATQQQDERKVGEMYLVETPVGGHPTLRGVEVSRCPATGRRDDPPRRSSTSTPGKIDAPADAARLPPRDARRQHQHERLQLEPRRLEARARLDVARSQARRRCASPTPRPARSARCSTRPSPTQFESRTRLAGALGRRTKSSGTRERDNWGQLYLYDLHDRQAEEPDHDRRRPGHADRAHRRADAHALVRGERHARRDRIRTSRTSTAIGLDGKHSVSLTPDDGTHTMQLSPDGKYLVDTYSKPDVAAGRRAARRRDGTLVMPLEKADISKLLATGWKPPMPIKMKAARRQDRHLRPDVPSDELRSERRSIRSSTTSIPGPQTRQRRQSRAFTAARGDKQALAELGFVVVTHRRHAARRAARSRSTTRTTARWDATTRSPIRSPA